ncbi:hypothetical protein HMH01_03660 [Halovulum dunhuangense]|uniref:Uncharacterized protein n=1 Tax=Halovulum dunhuangense TaxID=1505036 RepID=A0A849KVR7_9RHOB|nr:hypothetical protein [Halovulum dunhuangense]NNU79528.1 hypothetical protein [Halovulum dunhuangense]
MRLHGLALALCAGTALAQEGGDPVLRLSDPAAQVLVGAGGVLFDFPAARGTHRPTQGVMLPLGLEFGISPVDIAAPGLWDRHLDPGPDDDAPAERGGAAGILRGLVLGLSLSF